LIVTNSGTLIDASVCRIKDGAQFPGMSQEQALHLLVILNPYQHGHCFAIPRDDNWTRSARLQVRAESGFDLRHRSNLHSSTSSPAKNTQFRSFMAMARMRTRRSSASTR